MINHAASPKTLEALKRIRPISLGMGQACEVGGFKHEVIDDFLAVVDGRDDLPAAIQAARHLITLAPYQAVVIVRQYPHVEKSIEKIDCLFSRAAFGKKAIKNDEGRSVLVPARTGTLLLPQDHNGYFLKRPTNQFTLTNMLREKARGTLPDFEYDKLGFLKARYLLGTELDYTFRAIKKGFPEYLSVYLSYGEMTSEPGIMHWDTGYPAGEFLTESAALRKANNLPGHFSKAAQAYTFSPLPECVTIGFALEGGGTVLCKTHEDEYKSRGKKVLHFKDSDKIGYQAQNGDITIMRTQGWQPDENNIPRLAADHFAPMLNAYGNEGNHRGRIHFIWSSQVSFMSPHVFTPALALAA